MHSLPVDILFIILDYIDIDNKKNFLEYIKESNNQKYVDIIISLNNKINYKYDILKNIEYIYYNIESLNNKTDYMKYKNKIFNYNTKAPFNINLFAYKLVELYEGKLNGKQKKKFNNLCIFIKWPYMKDYASIQPKFAPKIQIKNNSFNTNTYLHIKQNLL